MGGRTIWIVLLALPAACFVYLSAEIWLNSNISGFFSNKAKTYLLENLDFLERDAEALEIECVDFLPEGLARSNITRQASCKLSPACKKQLDIVLYYTSYGSIYIGPESLAEQVYLQCPQMIFEEDLKSFFSKRLARDGV